MARKCKPSYQNLTESWCYIDSSNVLQQGSHVVVASDNGLVLISDDYYDASGNVVNESDFITAKCPDCTNAKPVKVCGGTVSVVPPACKSYFARVQASEQPFNFKPFNEFTIDYPAGCHFIVMSNIGEIKIDGGKYGGSLCSGEFCADIEDFKIDGNPDCLKKITITVRHF